MEWVAIWTITSVVGFWTNVFIVCALLVGGAVALVKICDNIRLLLRQAGLDLIQLYSGLEQSRLDIASRKHALFVETERARLGISEQRRMLLAKLDNE